MQSYLSEAKTNPPRSPAELKVSVAEVEEILRAENDAWLAEMTCAADPPSAAPTAATGS